MSSRINRIADGLWPHTSEELLPPPSKACLHYRTTAFANAHFAVIASTRSTTGLNATAEAMTELPPGWRVKNANGSFTGPPPIEDLNIDSASDEDEGQNPSENGGLDIRPDSPGWEDVEADTEAVSVQCLLCAENFSSPQVMLEHCESKHSFDFVATVKTAGLDFYKTIKYVNFIRMNVADASANPTVLDAATLDSDALLKPVLENDALLFSLDEVIDFDLEASNGLVDGEAMVE